MRVKCFIWKLVWDCLSCKFNLHHRGILAQPSIFCDLCRGLVEDDEHVIVTCQFAQQCWNCLVMRSKLHSTPHSLPAFFASLTHTQIEKWIKVLMCYMAWLLWPACNARIFQRQSITPVRLIRQLDCYLAYTDELPLRSHPESWGDYHVPRHIPPLHSLSWSPPSPSFGGLILNFDAAVQFDTAAIGFIIRDAYGNLLLAKGHRINPCSVPIAELVAAWYGLFKGQILTVQGDSLTVICWISKRSIFF